MKLYILILFLIFWVIVDAQPKNAVILHAEHIGGFPYIVYVDVNKQSPYYQRVANMGFNEFDIASYPRAVAQLKGSNKKPLKTIQIRGLSKQWYLLRLYKGRYYVYAPSDWGANYRIKFTDTTMIEMGVEDASPSLILNIKHIDANTYTLVRKAEYAGQLSKPLIIYLLPRMKGVAVFQNLAVQSNREGYTLMVNAAHLRDYPVIVSYCKEKTPEWKFDNPNFKKLLARSR